MTAERNVKAEAVGGTGMATVGAIASIQTRSGGGCFLAYTGPCRCLCARAGNTPFETFAPLKQSLAGRTTVSGADWTIKRGRTPVRFLPPTRRYHIMQQLPLVAHRRSREAVRVCRR